MKEIRALFLLARHHWGKLAIATLSVITITGLNLLGPMIIRELLSTIQHMNDTGNAMSRVAFLGIVLAGANIARAGCQFVANYVNHVAAWSFVAETRSRVYDHLQSLSMRFYQDKQTGTLMSRVVNDTANFEALIAHAIPDLISNVLVLVGVTVILFGLNWQLAVATLVPMPFLVWAVITFAKKIKPAFKRDREAIAELNSVLQDNLSGMREIQAFAQEEKESVRVLGAADGYTTATLSILRISSFYHPLIQFLGSIGTIAVVWYGGRLALQGHLKVEDLVAFSMYLGMFYGPVAALNQVNEQVQQALAGADRTFELLNTPSDIKEAKHPKRLKDIKGDIALEGVTFAYNDSTDVLENVTLKIPAGKTVALVGPTGVGKTTLASLIPRFYDPKEGRVTIDGVDVKELPLKYLRDNVSIVLQDVFLFCGTVRENLMYSKPNATQAEMYRAAELARAHGFIRALPEGYDTLIGERGVKLSGGQKQRLSIARAILRDAPILILDEATSAVDTQTEREIQAALAELSQGRTTIVIAHRLSTVRKADKIVVLEEGKILEEGLHDELLALNGLYAKLSQVQLA